MSNPFASPRSFDVKGLSVYLAMPAHRDIPPDTVIALLKTQAACQERGIPLVVSVTHGGSIVHHVRSKVAWDFLQGKHNRLFWIDSDIVWEPKDFLRVLALSTVMTIVGGAYPAKMEPTTFLGRGQGNLEINEHGCLPVGGIGTGFTCIDRTVYEQLALTAPKKRFHQIKSGPIPHIYFLPGEETDDGLGAEGEDMAFFARARALGHQLWVDPSISLGHVGQKVYRGRLLDHLQATQEAVVSDAA